LLAFSIIAVLVLILIFFVFKVQSLHKQISANRGLARQNAEKANTAYSVLSITARTLQKIFTERVEQASKKGLISGKNYEVMMLITSSSAKIIFDACEKGLSIEQALTVAIRDSELSMDDIKAMMQEQPNDVRISWVQNHADGFIKACDIMTLSLLTPRASSPQE